MMEEYQKELEAAFQQAKKEGASEEEITKSKSGLFGEIASTMAVQQSLQKIDEDQSAFFQISTEQEPGRNLRVKHVELQKAGFVTVGPPLIGSVDDKKDSAVYPLSAGTHDDFAIPLSRYMDRFEVYASLYEDDGDGLFDRSKDKVRTYRRKSRTDSYSFADPALIKVRFKSDVSANQYQSVYLSGKTKWEGLGLFDQVPGNLVNVYVARSYVPAWVAIHESNDGCVGKVLGTYSLLEEPFMIASAKKNGTYTPELAETFKDQQRQKDYFDIPLSRNVKGETLFAIMYEDNGDGRFDLATDKPMMGINNETVGIEFPVIKGRE